MEGTRIKQAPFRTKDTGSGLDSGHLGQRKPRTTGIHGLVEGKTEDGLKEQPREKKMQFKQRRAGMERARGEGGRRRKLRRRPSSSNWGSKSPLATLHIPSSPLFFRPLARLGSTWSTTGPPLAASRRTWSSECAGARSGRGAQKICFHCR